MNELVKTMFIQQFSLTQKFMQANISTQIRQLEKKIQQSLNSQLKNSHTDGTLNLTQNFNIVTRMQQVMKIFINSLKLNQKLYNSIVQKQAKINSGTNLFFDISSQTDSKIQDALKRTKQLYEDTVHQNQKARFLLQQFITPIRQQLRSKVDETTFSLQMKMLLDEYDVMGHQISYDKLEQQKQQKRKSVNSQTLSFLRDQILPVISHIEQKTQNNSNLGREQSGKIQQLSTKVKHLQSELNIQRQVVQEIQRQKIQRINSKMSDQLIDKKMRQTVRLMMKQFSSQIQGSIQKANRFSKTLQSTYTSQFQSIKSSLSSYISNQKAIQSYLKTQGKKHQKQIQQHTKFLQKNNIQLTVIEGKTKIYDENLHFVDKLSQKLQHLTSKIDNGELKSQNELNGQEFQELVKKLNRFQFQSDKLKKFQKESQQRTLTLKGQLQGIRDILSKKANFTDILLHIESKVDKRELKDLKLKLFPQEANHQNQTKNNSIILKQSDQTKSWKKRHIKSRSFFSPSPVQKPTQIYSETQQVKRFKLGFNHQFLLSNDVLKNQISKTQNLRKSILNKNPNTDHQINST